MIKANDPTLKSWVKVPEGSDFPIQNLPFGIFQKDRHTPPCVGTIIGDQVADLRFLCNQGFFEDLKIHPEVFDRPVLNDFIGIGKAKTRAVRNRLAEIFSPGALGTEAQALQQYFLFPADQVTMLLPLHIGDYTDFYSSIEHATNVGTMFRGVENALMPNWRHLPVGYHGRASSIVVTGTPVHRPKGQMMPQGADAPVFGPSKRLDFELETAFVIGRPTSLGQTVPVEQAEDYIFGLALFNDWSARDIQQWEYVPLGPFLGKNFASTLSPWIVTLEALEPFRVKGPAQTPEVLPYLRTDGPRNFDIHLEVFLQPEGGDEVRICHSNFKYLYWNMCQQLAHHTINGCNINIGDLMASGTISGPTPDSYGSMLELAWRGERPIAMPDGATRTFIQDGDSIIIRAWAERNGVRIGFGEAAGRVLPAI